ncbi:MAG TPA: enoyl-CoA hydratase-related protein [Dehalococcoidales bacterium]
MADKLVLFAQKGHAGYITLNRPEAGNGLNLEMIQDLAEICTQINGDEGIYLTVITGAGDVFCAGDHNPLQRADEGPGSVSAAEAVAGLDCPTVAAINGDAIGPGLELALACDLRIAANKAKFGLPQISSGKIPQDGGTQRLSRLVGRGKALELVLTGEIIDAQTAFEIGLVNKIVPGDKLDIEIQTIAQTLASKAPLAMSYAKEAVNKGLDVTLEQGLRLEADLYFLLHTTADRTEGITAFLQKRKPDYEGK